MMQISIIFSKNEVLSKTIFEYCQNIIKPDDSIYSCKAITFDSIQFALKLNQKQWKI